MEALCALQSQEELLICFDQIIDDDLLAQRVCEL
jgi:hypothetical protein